MTRYPGMPSAPFGVADQEIAHREWGCNCGPGAVAAILGISLDAVRPLMGDFERKRYTNPTLMWEVLGRTGLNWKKLRPPLTWPAYGLARIQWHGPWMSDGVPVRARYRMTHWVASRSQPGCIAIFDINALSAGGWIPLKVWGERLVPWLLEQAVPRADGQWSITHAVEIEPGDDVPALAQRPARAPAGSPQASRSAPLK